MAKQKSKFIKIIERSFIIVIVIAVTAVIVKATDNKLSGNIEEVGICPEGMVHVVFAKGDFCIDKYEVSAGNECLYEQPKSQRESLMNIDSSECEPVSVLGKVPWRYISQNQAAIACAKAGKRLPTNEEWLQAAYGTSDLATEWSSDDCHIDSNWPSQPGETGYGENCVSASGAYDMIGNVWEWVDGLVEDGKFMGKELPEDGYIIAIDDKAMPVQTDNNPEELYFNDYFWIKTKGNRSIARGGSWNNQSEAGQYSIYAVSAPSAASAGVGFRCVK